MTIPDSLVLGLASGQLVEIRIPYSASGSRSDREIAIALLARIPHKLVEQMGGRGVRRLENTELYDDTLYRPEPHRL
jgi:hypothetical protein